MVAAHPLCATAEIAFLQMNNFSVFLQLGSGKEGAGRRQQREPERERGSQRGTEKGRKVRWKEPGARWLAMGRMYGGKEGRAHRKYRFNTVHSMDHI